MTNLRLSEHFTLAEFERSATAKANGIDNRVPSLYVTTLKQLSGCNLVIVLRILTKD